MGEELPSTWERLQEICDLPLVTTGAGPLSQFAKESDPNVAGCARLIHQALRGYRPDCFERLTLADLAWNIHGRTGPMSFEAEMIAIASDVCGIASPPSSPWGEPIAAWKEFGFQSATCTASGSSCLLLMCETGRPVELVETATGDCPEGPMRITSGPHEVEVEITSHHGEPSLGPYCSANVSWPFLAGIAAEQVHLLRNFVRIRYMDTGHEREYSLDNLKQELDRIAQNCQDN
jgi:hypothetical protein